MVGNTNQSEVVKLPTDRSCRSFLDSLDDADNITPSDWETRFIESTLTRSIFTEKQKKAILQMMERYERRLDW